MQKNDHSYTQKLHKKWTNHRFMHEKVGVKQHWLTPHSRKWGVSWPLWPRASTVWFSHDCHYTGLVWDIVHTIFWSLIVASSSGTMLWPWWFVISRFWAPVINNDNRWSVETNDWLTDFQITTLDPTLSITQTRLLTLSLILTALDARDTHLGKLGSSVSINVYSNIFHQPKP